MRSDWWRHGVFYQIYPRSFQDSNGDGVGELRGIISRLDHLNDGTPASLGVDAVWISPFYPSPMADFGYDVTDYCDVDPTFGTLADFDRLLAEAHARGIRVIIDFVPNHTSDRHPWFIESRSSRANPRRDWYIWADPKPDGSPPNNWRSAFPSVGSAWTLDPVTGQHFLHHFLPAQPDLNWWNPEVRAAMEAVLRFWLDRGVDGFRIDVAHGLVKDRRLRDNRRLYVGHTGPEHDWDQPEVHEIYRSWRRILNEYGDRMAVGEVYILDVRRVVRYYGRARAGGGSSAHADARASQGERSEPGRARAGGASSAHADARASQGERSEPGRARSSQGERSEGDELHLAFNFWFLRRPWRAEAFRAAVEQFERLLPAGAWPNYTLSNHDHSRAASRYGPAQARVAALMVLTLRGTPFLYQGEEIGMTDVPIARSHVVDVDGRDPERTPMQWDDSLNAGFTAGRPWLPLARDYRRVNVARQRADPASMFSLYRRLIWFRKSSPALRWGRYRSLRAPEGVYAYVRESGEERLLVALNFWGRPRRFRHGSLPRHGVLELSTDPARSRGQIDLRPLYLGPHEGSIVRIS